MSASPRECSGATFRAKLRECHTTGHGWKNLSLWMMEKATDCEEIVQVWRDEFANSSDESILQELLRIVGLAATNIDPNPYPECLSRILEPTMQQLFEKQPSLKSNIGFLTDCNKRFQSWASIGKFGATPRDLSAYITKLQNMQKLRDRFPEVEESRIEELLTENNNSIAQVFDKLNVSGNPNSHEVNNTSSVADDPRSDLSLKSQKSVLSDGVSSMSSWADEVEAEMGECSLPLTPSLTAALAAQSQKKSTGSPGRLLDQFSAISNSNSRTLTHQGLQQHNKQQQIQQHLMKQKLVRAQQQQQQNGKNGLSKHIQAHVQAQHMQQQLMLEKARKEKEKQQALAAQQAAAARAADAERQTTTTSPPITPVRLPAGANGKPLTESELLPLLWTKLVQLEHKCKCQEEEISRLQKLEAKVEKLDDFVLETRTEMGRIMQRQLNVERGGTSSACSESGSSRGGRNKSSTQPAKQQQWGGGNSSSGGTGGGSFPSSPSNLQRTSGLTVNPLQSQSQNSLTLSSPSSSSLTGGGGGGHATSPRSPPLNPTAAPFVPPAVWSDLDRSTITSARSTSSLCSLTNEGSDMNIQIADTEDSPAPAEIVA